MCVCLCVVCVFIMFVLCVYYVSVLLFYCSWFVVDVSLCVFVCVVCVRLIFLYIVFSLLVRILFAIVLLRFVVCVCLCGVFVLLRVV